MKFSLTQEQQGFARALDTMLSGADVPNAVRAWSRGTPDPGLALWQRVSEIGVTSLCDPDAGASPADVVVAFEQLGRHAVPGPWVESAVFLPTALPERAEEFATGLHTVGLRLALDADQAAAAYVVHDGQLHTAQVGEQRTSIDPARRLFAVTPTAPIADAALAAAHDLASLASAAQLVGAGFRVLEDTVDYTKARVQFGQPIGKFQAIKHLLADAKVALDFARPLVWGAALDPTPRDVSAAKVAAGEAAYTASRAALQAHGAIGYTQEYDLGLWLLKIRALRSAYGTPSFHRGRVLEALVNG